MNERNSRAFLIVAAAAAIAVFLYEGSLTGPFVFDDEHNILLNRHIRIDSLSFDSLWSAAFESPVPNRPVANASFALNYLFNGYNVVGYRSVNLLIHLLNGLLVYALAAVTLRIGDRLPDGRISFAAAAAGALWMLHPLHTQSVAYIVQRMTCMATFFYLGTLLCYAHARRASSPRRRAGLLAASAASGLLALGSKEIAATLPAFLFLYEWFFFRDLDRRWLRRHPHWLLLIVAATVSIGFMYIRTGDPVAYVSGGYPAEGGVTALQRLMTQFRVVCEYMWLLAWPSPDRLNLDRDVTFSHALLDPPATILSLGLIVLLLAAAVALARRQRMSSFAILWFFGNLAIESSFIRLETMFEHRTYLPSVMPAIALAGWAAGRLSRRWAAVALPVVLACLWSGWTWQRCQVWGDPVALWQDCVRKSPAKARPYNNLGGTYMRLGRLTEAIQPLETAIALSPDFPDAWYNLGYALLRLGKLQEGIEATNRLLDLEPRNFMAHNNIGIAHILLGEPELAVPYLEAAVEIKPDYETAWNNLGVALKSTGDLNGAKEKFSRAIAIQPMYAEACNNLGLTLKELGDMVGAAEQFKRALAIEPDYGAAAQNLEELGR